MTVASGLQSSEEQGLFVLHPFADAQIPLEHVRIVKVMRGLNDGDLRVVEESDGIFQKGSSGNVVHVEDRNDLSIAQSQCVVEVAGFCMTGPVGTRNIFTAERGRQFPGSGTVAVIQHVDLEPILGIVLGQAADECLSENRQRFVDDRDHDINGGVCGDRRGLSFRRRPRLIGEETELAEAVELRHVDDGPDNEPCRLLGRDRIEQAPEHVAGVEKKTEDQNPAATAVLLEQEPDDKENETGQAEGHGCAEEGVHIRHRSLPAEIARSCGEIRTASPRHRFHD